VVAGTTASALRAGAGHYPETPLPCEIGNVAIAGHRTTYGRPFHNLDLLNPGDRITLETPIGSCTYEVSREPWIVMPTAIEVVANTPDEAALTLTTCHPKGSARERLIVRATMVSSEVDI
jgi:sortase A